ncbi:MAG: serine/threonine protein kinase [Polyangiales bacterium]
MSESLRDGRFVRLGPLGEGSQGATFDGMDKREGRAVAIKRFDVRGAKAWKDVELAEREARVLEALHHPKIPAYVDHFESEGALYLVMEKIEGESLAALRKRGAVLSEGDVVRLLRDASEVLEYLHGRAPAVIHRDLKPGNVIRRPDGSFAFVDFGAVRDKLRPQGGSTVVGTFGYMAPEQFQGRASPASDVYAIGATALTMLTGEEPENLPHKGLAIDVRSALIGRASDGMIEVLERMLEPDPEKRAGKIAPLLERLREAPRTSKHTRSSHEERREEHRSRYEKRQRERDERREKRRERRGHRHARGLPFPVAVVVAIALTFAMIAVGVATQIVVPLVLAILSLFGIPRMLEAARRVREAGARANRSITEARGRIQGRLAPPRAEDDPRIRVAPGEPTRTRVSTDEEDYEAAARVSEEEEETRERRRNK